ncbi:hypothetical protein [Mangrovicoccus sp. HB161399]|uniref:hypothetical protein n=1 Tax=Mangrovicoccus sp. HB161399 TaxID=2720392 RepID=UPI0015559993|nr:hypothetical protein [Mangrovicoccus sp. HB161399]
MAGVGYMAETDPIRETDGGTCALARRRLAEARFAELAVTDRKTGAPTVSRIALVPEPNGGRAGIWPEF